VGQLTLLVYNTTKLGSIHQMGRRLILASVLVGKKGSSIHLNFLFGLWKVETKAVGGGSPRRPKKIHSDLSPSSRTVLESWGKNTRVKPTAQYEVLVPVPVPVLLDFFFYFGLLLLLF
jgi:hypothetical protein